MPFRLINTLKNKAGQMACSSFLYDWSLSETTPDRLVVRPADPWTGDAEKARALLSAAGVSEESGAFWDEDWWEPEDADDAWINHMHSFIWLRDLRTLGGRLAARQGQIMIESWLSRYTGWHKSIWRGDLTGQRLSLWISHYDYFCAGIDMDFEERVLSSIVKQSRHLQYALGNVREIEFFHAVKGLLYAGLALEGHERWIDQALNALEKGIDRQILADGGHASRSASTLLETLEIMVDIKGALKAGDYPVPEFLEDTIQEMSCAVRFFRYGDRKMTTLQGTQEGNSTKIDSILAQACVRGKQKQSLPYSGFERASLGRSLLLIDVGKSPESPFDAKAHASPLAFEFCYGKERLFVSCGTHPTSPIWRDALRFTAAHNTASLDYRNACEIRKDGHFGRRVTKFSLNREETRDSITIEGSHNGYEPLNGITHRRKFHLGDEGHELRGEDEFICAIKLVRPVEIAMRFHLHPSVTVSLTRDGKSAILRMPGGLGWRFQIENGTLSLEDSLYMGSCITPRKTRQVVVSTQMTGEHNHIFWNLKREG